MNQVGLYEQVLGEGFDRLPASLRHLHNPQVKLEAAGRCSVQRGPGLLVPLVALVMGFPAAASDLPLRFQIERRGDAEIWTRHFGGSRLLSVFRVQAGRLRERMGPLSLEQSLDLRADGLHLVPHRAWFLGLRLPRFLLPQVRAVAWEGEGPQGPCYRFDVSAGLPWIGEVVRYRGWLVPA